MFLHRAGITAAAGTRLALDLILVKGFELDTFQEHDSKSRALIFPVTASLKEHWAIYVTAATHRPKSRLSGFFSGVSPKTPVIHNRRGSPIHYHRNLMQKNHDRLAPKRGHAGYCESPRPLAGAGLGQYEQPSPEERAVAVVLAVGYKRYSV